MAILGAHMSIAGGYYRAVERAHEAGCDCVQLFTKNNNQWRAKEISADDVQRFQAALKQQKISHPIAHDSYLINLASPDDALWKRSIDAFIEELQRAELLGIPYVVAHPGSYTTSSEAAGIQRVIQALDEVHAQTPSLSARGLLETTAGQGTNLGWKFEHLAAMLDGVRDTDRLGVCFDTCHVHAAGYAMRTKKQYQTTIKAFNALIGVKRLKAFHLNDSKRERGSRVDRHAHIGQGTMGIAPFRHLLADRRFRRVPMYLETPKSDADGREMDKINLARLRKLIPRRSVPSTS